MVPSDCCSIMSPRILIFLLVSLTFNRRIISPAYEDQNSNPSTHFLQTPISPAEQDPIPDAGLYTLKGAYIPKTMYTHMT